jgi:hypothetical protein
MRTYCHFTGVPCEPVPLDPVLEAFCETQSAAHAGQLAHKSRRAPDCFGIAVATYGHVPRTLCEVLTAFERGDCSSMAKGHRIGGAASPFQPAQRISVDVCVVD